MSMLQMTVVFLWLQIPIGGLALSMGEGLGGKAIGWLNLNGALLVLAFAFWSLSEIIINWSSWA